MMRACCWGNSEYLTRNFHGQGPSVQDAVRQVVRISCTVMMTGYFALFSQERIVPFTNVVS